MIGGRRPAQGRKPADRRVRVERPHSPLLPLRRTRTSSSRSRRPTSPRRGRAAPGRASGRVAIGRPLASEEEIGERLSKTKALAIFSSDAISSSAYATEEIMRVLVAGRRGGAARSRSRSSIAIAVLLAVVSISYRQVCRAYPNGGGAYVVAQDEPQRRSSG